MPSINIQFHALVEEVCEMVLSATKDETVYFVLIDGPPFSAREISRSDLLPQLVVASKGKTPPSLFVLTSPPNLSATSRLKFYDLNVNAIAVVDIGWITEKGLKQSALSAVTQDPRTLVVAKKVANAMRKATHVGVTSVNVDLGVRHLNKRFRYTDGAKHLEQDGVPMLPFAGGTKLLLSDLQ